MTAARARDGTGTVALKVLLAAVAGVGPFTLGVLHGFWGFTAGDIPASYVYGIQWFFMLVAAAWGVVTFILVSVPSDGVLSRVRRAPFWMFAVTGIVLGILIGEGFYVTGHRLVI